MNLEDFEYKSEVISLALEAATNKIASLENELEHIFGDDSEMISKENVRYIKTKALIRHLTDISVSLEYDFSALNRQYHGY